MPWCQEGHELQQDDKFCPRCGKERITKCVNGHDFKPIYDDFGNERRPDYCRECGTPFDWANQ